VEYLGEEEACAFGVNAEIFRCYQLSPFLGGSGHGMWLPVWLLVWTRRAQQMQRHLKTLKRPRRVHD